MERILTRILNLQCILCVIFTKFGCSNVETAKEVENLVVKDYIGHACMIVQDDPKSDVVAFGWLLLLSILSSENVGSPPSSKNSWLVLGLVQHF